MRRFSSFLVVAAALCSVASPLLASLYYCATPAPDRTPSSCSYLCQYDKEYCGWTCYHIYIKCDDENFDELCLQSAYTGPTTPTCDKVQTRCSSTWKYLLDCWTLEEVDPTFIEGLDIMDQLGLGFRGHQQCDPSNQYHIKTVGGSTTGVNCSGVTPGVF